MNDKGLLNMEEVMFFRCTKCGHMFAGAGDKNPDICGAFVEYRTVYREGEPYGQNVAIGCGGELVQISEEEAQEQTDRIRND